MATLISEDKKQWESHYDSEVKHTGFEKFAKIWHTPYVQKLLKYGKGAKRSLEFGSGKGSLSLSLKRVSPKTDTYLLDFSQNAVDYSEALYQHYGKKGHFIRGSFLDLPFKKNYFGMVHGNTVLEHVVDTRKAVKELVRVTEPGGYVMVTVPNRYRRYDGHDLYHYAFNLKYYSRTFYMRELRKHFEDEGCEVVDEFGTATIFMLPSYIGLALLRLCRGERKKSEGTTKTAARAKNSAKKSSSVYDDLDSMKGVYRKWFFPLYWLERGILWLEYRINEFFDFILPLPAQAKITIGIVVRKKKAT